ncbi:MAG: hypothetical protein ACRCT8_06320 [Lacipirellulaceae bacterium]
MTELSLYETSNDIDPHGVYCVCLSSAQRPTLLQVEEALAGAGGRGRVAHLEADDDGRFLAAIVEAPEDAATLRFTYHEGPEVVQRARDLAAWLVETLDRPSLKKVAASDARLDVEHFEHSEPATSRGLASRGLAEDDSVDDATEPIGGPLDPASLLATVAALVRLTGGVALDTVAGERLL